MIISVLAQCLPCFQRHSVESGYLAKIKQKSSLVLLITRDNFCSAVSVTTNVQWIYEMYETLKNDIDNIKVMAVFSTLGCFYCL